ncbi:MarR family winged helix-turn-helix transcriptional regulator [Idiomarina aminovorans]|uniref:MarR family winged helix-turn-helix transcriptional regulator n=1 Tax=Idiomarina aminovorans TaxID=2914829 RepID=UPI002004AB4A|nr:MarR family transcriptional regulator [Idiomarina sp. ATCH4]MCK7460348.1 MarR family transcriptional regulator [Idiomarina sp. ATCH4]
MANDDNGNKALKLDNQLCFALYSTSLAMNKLYKPLLSKLDLTYPQYLILLLLWERDGVTVTEISRKLFQEKGALSPVIKRLEQRGLITRKRSSEDERQLHLYLTEQGHKLKQSASDVPEQVFCATQLEPSEALALKQTLESLRAQLQAKS